MLIYRRLNNVFVQGILEAYWGAYEAVGLNVFADYIYLQAVWNFHQTMIDSIIVGEYDSGYKALVEHKDLLYHRPHQILEPESQN
jgi:DNA-binding FadR family transcriptional regulator